MNGRLMASPTTPLPLTRSSSCPTRSLRTVLSLPTSPGRTTPRTVMVWRSELTSRSLVASTTMVPLGSTPETRAVSVVEMTTPRLVVPWPLSSVSPLTPVRLAHGPVALVMPASALTEFLVLETREVLVAPVTTAEAFSTTRMVIMSSTWLALRSRAPPASPAARGHVVIQRSRRGFLLGGKRTACDQHDQNQRLHRLPFVTTTLPLDSTRA